MRILVTILLCCFGFIANGEDDRIRIKGTINGHPVELILDTGSDAPMLFRSTAERLRLKIVDPPIDIQPTPGEVAAGFTEPCEFLFQNSRIFGEFRVFDLPPGLPADLEGLLGWSVFTDEIVSFDAARQAVDIGDELPGKVATWQKFRMAADARDLAFTISEEGGPHSTVHVDTGDSGGVAIHPFLWEKLTTNLTNQPSTLSASYFPATGVIVRKKFWADELSIGSLVLKGVPVTVEAEQHVQSKTNLLARIGLYALRRMDLVVDGKNGVAYANSLSNSPPPFDHNRLGAVFVPKDTQSDRLLAHVARDSPAFQVGIRDGDVLLKIGELDVTKWRTDAQVMPLSRFWEQPAGTSLDLTLRRAELKFRVTATLKDILGPHATTKAVE